MDPEPFDSVVATHGAQSPRRQPRRMTVVEDNEEFLDLLHDLFREEFEVTGVRHLESVNALADTAPAVLIIDLRLDAQAGISGREIVTLVRGHESLRHVPIIVCTGDVVGLRREGDGLLALGNLHLIAKPFAIEELESLVHRLTTPQQLTMPQQGLLPATGA
jgi:CheY-like chemotaxis protein